MASRMDKYHSESIQPVQSRSQKNEHLYEELYTNKVFTEFTNVENNNVVELNNSSAGFSSNKRENFQKTKSLYSDDFTSRKRFISDKKYEFEDPTEKNYNINDILDEARKNRTTPDELEKKRHLKTVEYNILADLSQEKLKENRDKKQKLSKEEEENLEELIHTITSNSLRKKIDDELLSDLLPSEESETLISKELLDEIEDVVDKVEENPLKEDTDGFQIDHSFYTKSMDLSKEDFEFDEEDRSFLEDTKMSVPKKILIVLFILIVLGVIGYVIYRFI